MFLRSSARVSVWMTDICTVHWYCRCRRTNDKNQELCIFWSMHLPVLKRPLMVDPGSSIWLHRCSKPQYVSHINVELPSRDLPVRCVRIFCPNKSSPGLVLDQPTDGDVVVHGTVNYASTRLEFKRLKVDSWQPDTYRAVVLWTKQTMSVGVAGMVPHAPRTSFLSSPTAQSLKPHSFSGVNLDRRP